MDGLLLELVMQNLPLLLKSSNELLTLLFRHQHLLTISLILFFYLHLTDKVVFVFDLSLDLGEIIWYLTIGFLFEVVFILVCSQFWR